MRISRQFSLFCAAALSIALVSIPAEAQRGERGGEGGAQRGQRGGGAQRGGQRGGGQRGGGQRGGQIGRSISRSQLLRSEDVQKELNVTDAQMETIKEAMDAFRKDNPSSRPDITALRNLSGEERAAKIQEMREASAKSAKEADSVLDALLEPAQAKRLGEISFQLKAQAGLGRLLDSDEIREQLSVTEEQVAKLTEIKEAAEKAARAATDEMRQAFRSGNNGGERPDFRKMMEDM